MGSLHFFMVSRIAITSFSTNTKQKCGVAVAFDPNLLKSPLSFVSASVYNPFPFFNLKEKVEQRYILDNLLGTIFSLRPCGGENILHAQIEK